MDKSEILLDQRKALFKEHLMMIFVWHQFHLPAIKWRKYKKQEIMFSKITKVVAVQFSREYHHWREQLRFDQILK